MIELKLGDCLNIMGDIPDNSIDMVLTDPPYGMNYQSGRRKTKAKLITGDQDISFLDDLSRELYRVAKENTAHYIFCSYHNIDKFKQSFEKYFKIKNILTWVKNNASMGDLSADFAPKTEFILFLQKGRRNINGKRDSNVLEFKKTNNKLHPTQKPVDMIEFMISKFSDKGDVILDPFMGSGSTAVACINTNRSFIGIEIDNDYFNIAKERVNNH
jgi:site-specific DNA-methyltransferase (adenine-specific)|nr:MAG TPA: adenine-specific methyltransferase [Caudoviricetes sp.]